MIVVWILLGIIGLAVAAFALLWMNAIRNSFKRNAELEAMLRPAVVAIQNNDPGAEAEVHRLAAAPATRLAIFHKLNELDKSELFPLQFRTPQMLAEGDLAQWLMHPHELASAPAEMQLVRSFPVQEDSKSGTCYLFRFRAAESSWAAGKGWMAGVAGPVWDDAEPGQGGRATFSELTPFDQMSEEEHVEYIRRSQSMTGLVMPS